MRCPAATFLPLLAVWGMSPLIVSPHREMGPVRPIREEQLVVFVDLGARMRADDYALHCMIMQVMGEAVCE